jgi:hypothetical protein
MKCFISTCEEQATTEIKEPCNPDYLGKPICSHHNEMREYMKNDENYEDTDDFESSFESSEPVEFGDGDEF